MLSYLGFGERRYGVKPVNVMQRTCWEFQAVLTGEIARIEPSQSAPEFQTRSLWLSSPGTRHGWNGRGDSPAEVAVFHFSTVPESLPHLCEKTGFLRIALQDSDCARLRDLAHRASRYQATPAPSMLLCYQHALLELSLLVLEHYPAAITGNRRDSDQRVSAALTYFTQHLAENPSQERIAAQVGVAPSHLRRIFHEVLKTSPKRMFDQIRFQRAMEMLADGNMTCEAISEACGFESSSSFSRAFFNKFGNRPSSWL